MVSYKNRYVNGKPSGQQIPVNYTIYLDNPTDYLLEEGDGEFQITPRNSAGGTSAICSLIQKEATPLILSGDYWPKEDDKYKYIVSFM